MKTEELLTLGLNEDQIKAVMVMNGKDVEQHKRTIADLTTERDGINARLSTATEALQKFEGIDPAQLKDEIAKYKTRAEQAERTYAAQILERDQRDWLGKKFDAYGVTSPFARKQLTADAMSKDSGLSWRDGSFFGFDDFMAAAKKQDASLYMTEEERKVAAEAAKPGAAPTKPAPKFVGKTGEGADTDKKYTPPKIF